MLLALAAVVVDEAVEKVLGEVLHLASGGAAEHDAPLEEEQRVASALVDLVAEHPRASQQRCDIDVVPLGVRGRNVQLGDVVEILLNAELGDRLLR